MNHPDPAVDRKWAETAKRRLEELRSGRVKAIPGDQVFVKVREGSRLVRQAIPGFAPLGKSAHML